MRHLDLFTGILGFSYAAEQVWKEEYELVACCEIDKFCQQIIRKHRGNVEIINDVKDEKIKQFRDIDLLTAGVPCQPASVAGQKRGTSDERWLWPETLDIIGTVKPRWAILENVPGLFNLENGIAFNRILSGLAESGYDCWWETIPACAVGACHRRDRIWIIAYNTSNRFQGWRLAQHKNKAGFVTRQNINVTNADSEHGKEYQPRNKFRQAGSKTPFGRSVYEPTWQENWVEVATRLCALDDGLSGGLVRPKGWRVNGLKASGNSIVPQVAMVIMESIKGQTGLFV